MPLAVNEAFMRILKRAEGNDPSKLVATFVDVGPLFSLLSSKDHQVIYGRRGTGKTHALTYLAEIRKDKGEPAAFIDMRTVGSSGGIFADPAIPIAERATRLLVDTLGALHTSLLQFSIETAEQNNLAVLGPVLDDLAAAASQVKVVGTVEVASGAGVKSAFSTETSHGLTLTPKDVSLGLSSKESASQQVEQDYRFRESGIARHRVHFGSVRDALTKFVSALGGKQIWVLLDEWSDVPLDLQPYLADLLRRCFFPIRGITVKLAAIEQRSRFRLLADGDYVGIEIGADATADVNLDDFMVFDNDQERAKRFFQELLFHHIKAIEDVDRSALPKTSNALVQVGFTQVNAFDELVKAAEGVPRDAINIVVAAAQKALDEKISINHVRGAAHVWYQRDKDAAVTSNPDAHALLQWIIAEVIGTRRARAFLLRAGVSHPLIESLFDSRVLHILKRSIAAHDQPGVRYNAFKLDYGCYVDLMMTAKAPEGLLPSDDETAPYVDVPPDDYRSIRRAILDLDKFAGRPA